MQPYQEEYLENLKDVISLASGNKPEGQSFEEYSEKALRNRQLKDQKIKRNMEILREWLFPLLDHLFEAEDEKIAELEEFSDKLLVRGAELDAGLFCQIHQALLSRARMMKDRDKMIKELYWLGMGRNSLCNRVVNLNLSDVESYMLRMRLCFTEAAAYLKYFNEIENTETKGYILRSRANMSLGKFKSVSEKINLIKYTLNIFQDKWYQEQAPELPWDRYIYMTHQQMSSSISYSKGFIMTPEDIQSIMESVYIVHERQFKDAESRGERPAVRYIFAYNAINFYCGLFSLNELLKKMEEIMDGADSEDFSVDGMYSLISIPAFYCNFLTENPEFIPERKEYLSSLYRKVFDYIEAFPRELEAENLFYYLRQLTLTYVETENSVTYEYFIQKIMRRFTPDIYVHSYIVGKAAMAFCEIIMDEEPAFFDDIDDIRQITDPEKKRKEVLEYAMKSGLLHDVGKIHFVSLYSKIARQWFEEEYEMAQLHTMTGKECLDTRPSTQRYAMVALGHHSWYDGSRGYPNSYKRLECSCRQMVDVIGLIDWIDNVTYTTSLYTGNEKDFDEAIKSAIELEGKRFSPLLTTRLCDTRVVEKLRKVYQEGRREAYMSLYHTEYENNNIQKS